jgi:hypothetical protein
MTAGRDIGVFDPVPCPHCGTTTSTDSGGYWGGGLLVVLIRSTFAGYRCFRHGPIPHAQFPPQHQSMITARRLIKGLGSVVMFFVVIGLILLRLAL